MPNAPDAWRQPPSPTLRLMAGLQLAGLAGAWLALLAPMSLWVGAAWIGRAAKRGLLGD